ncbi:E3 ubiquitin-protein ligase RNF212B [Mantella aurantiaca]
MDWFHCNVCHLQQDTNFYITTCGHTLCQACITQDYCSVCRSACKYLPISENLKPHEKIFFRNPKETLLIYFNNIAQAWRFQKQQHELHVTFYKQYITKNQNAFQEALLKINTLENELKAIKKENAELKSLLTHLKGSLSRSQSNSRSCTPRPIAITSPSQTVTPRPSSHHNGQFGSRSSSLESLGYVRSHSGSSQPPSASRAQDRTTPLSSSDGSPMSGHSMNYSLPAQTTSASTSSYNSQRSELSRNMMPTPTERTFHLSRGAARESCVTPCNNSDRLRTLLVLRLVMDSIVAFKTELLLQGLPPSSFLVASFDDLTVEAKILRFRGLSDLVIPILFHAVKSTSRMGYNRIRNAYFDSCKQKVTF